MAQCERRRIGSVGGLRNGGQPEPRLPLHILREMRAVTAETVAGKLSEALLHRAGAIGAPGSLERGTTVSDFDPMERKAQHSLNAALRAAGDGRIDGSGGP